MNPPRRRLLGRPPRCRPGRSPRVCGRKPIRPRPISMIVPASAGGPTDAIGRVLAERMGALLADHRDR